MLTTTSGYVSDGSDTLDGLTSFMTYDKMGRIVTTLSEYGKDILYKYNKNGDVTEVTDWNGHTSKTEYDGLGRIYKQIDALGIVVSTKIYDNFHQQISEMDGEEYETKYVYDKQGNIAEVVNPAGNSVYSSYDINGNLVSYRDAENNRTKYGYDYLGRLVEVVNALSEMTRYSYDNNGNMITQTDGGGRVTTYEYNSRDLMDKRIVDGGISLDARGNITYDYNKVESFSYNGNVAPETHTDFNGVTTFYNYDIHGRTSKVTAGDDEISYGYDNNGNVVVTR